MCILKTGERIQGKYLFLEIYMVSRTQCGFVLGLFVSFCLSEGGSDLGLQLFVRSWQHLAALRGEVCTEKRNTLC